MEEVENQEMIEVGDPYYGDTTEYSYQLTVADKMSFVQDGLEKSTQLVKSIENIYYMKQRTKQLESMTKVQLANTAAKYQLCHEFFANTFHERHEALQKHYDLLDNAINSGNNELIIAALTGISNIVTSSPLADLQKMAQLFEDTSVPLLDF